MQLTADNLAQMLAADAPAARYLVAFSGGLDSSVLLHLAATQAHLKSKLVAVHVNHKLQAGADAWADHCASQCQRLGVPLHLLTVSVRESAGEGLEAAARDARYQAIGGVMQHGDVLLTAHHADDQAETILLRLLRGAGPQGLGGMRAVRRLGDYRLARPLLRWSRAELEAYAQQHGLSFVEDVSNLDHRFDRNFIRHAVMPLLRRRWPGCANRINRSGELCDHLSTALVDGDNQDSVWLDTASIPLELLRPLTPIRRQWLVRSWLDQQGLLAPGSRRLDETLRQFLEAAADRTPRMELPGYALRRFRDAIHAVPNLPVIPADAVWQWQPQASLHLAELGGTLSRTAAAAGERIDPRWGDASFEVRLRQGGERCRPAGRGGSCTLKQLLQESNLPPWERDRLPLIFLDGQLVAVPGICVCEPFQAGVAGGGFQIRWVSNHCAEN